MIESNVETGGTAVKNGSRLFLWTAGILIVFVAVVLYFQTRNYEMLFDDVHLIKENASITSLKEEPAGFFKLFVQEFWKGSHEESMTWLKPKNQALYRPVMLAALGIIYTFSGDQSTPYHVANILLYAAVCLLVFIALRKLFGSTRLAFFAALIFTCHPLHTESVAYITGMGELLGALFFLLALIFYVKAGYDMNRFRLLPYLLSLFFFLIGLFTKEHVATLIGVLLLYDFIQALAGRRPLGFAARIGMLLGYLLMVGVNLAARFHAIGTLRPGDHNPLDNVIAVTQSYPIQLWTALKVLVKGIWLTILPLKLSPDYSFAAITLNLKVFEAEVIAAILFLLTLMIIAFWMIKRRPVISFGILWYFITIIVVSNILIKVGTIFGERLLFLPSLGFCLVAACILDRIFVLGSPKKGAYGAGAYISTILLIALAGTFSLKTLKENRKWENEERLWEVAVKTSPSSAKVRFQLGQIYAKAPFFQEAEAEYKRALEIEPSFVFAQLSLAHLYMVNQQFEKSLQRFEVIQQSLAGSDRNNLETEVRIRLAQLYTMMKKPEEAIDQLMAMKAEDNSAVVNMQLGDRYMECGDHAKAERFYREAWELAPETFSAAYKLLSTYTARQMVDKEKELLDRIEKEDPDPYRAYLCRAGLCFREFDKEKALEALDRAIDRNPERPQAYGMKASVLQSEFRYEEALEMLDKTLDRSPPKSQSEPLLRQLEIHKELGDLEKAAEVADRLARLPQSLPIKAAMGELFLKQQRFEEAGQLLKEAIAGGMKTTANYVNLGEALNAQEKYEDVVALLTPAVEEMNLVDSKLFLILGVALNASGEYEKGVDLLEQTLKLYGKNPWVKYHIASGKLELKNYEEAWSIFDFLAHNKNVTVLHPFIFQKQARILLEDTTRQDPEAAVAMARSALEALPEGGDASFYLTLIKALRASGRLDEAKKTVEEALKKFPDDPGLKEFVDN